MLTDLQRYDEARRAFDRMIALGKGEMAHFGRALLCVHLKQYPQALEHLTRAIRATPDSPEVIYQRGVVLSLMGRPRDALVQFREASRLSPDNWRYINSAAICHANLGQFSTALAGYDKALALAGKHHGAGTVLGNRAAVHVKQGQPRKALADLREAIRRRPDWGKLYMQRGDLYLRWGRFQQARGDFDKAITLSPEVSHAFNHRGLVHWALGQHAKALADWQRAVALDRASASAWYNLACGLARTPRKAEAVNAFVKAVALGFDDAKLARTDRALDPIRGDPRLAAALREIE